MAGPTTVALSWALASSRGAAVPHGAILGYRVDQLADCVREPGACLFHDGHNYYRAITI